MLYSYKVDFIGGSVGHKRRGGFKKRKARCMVNENDLMSYMPTAGRRRKRVPILSVVLG
jgi:hypothetical protein